MHIKNLYQKLLKSFGRAIYPPANSTFEVCTRIILTQRTKWENVMKLVEVLKGKNLLHIKKIAEIEIKELQFLLRPLGFSNRKAETLKKFAQYCLEKYNGKLEKWFQNEEEKLRKEFLQIPGIGPETADALLLSGAKKPIFVVDAYSQRIFSRIGIIKKGTQSLEIKNMVEKEIGKDWKKLREFRLLLIELAQKYCHNKPKCNQCPLVDFCEKNL